MRMLLATPTMTLAIAGALRRLLPTVALSLFTLISLFVYELSRSARPTAASNGAGTLFVAGPTGADHLVLLCAGFPDDHSSLAPLARLSNHGLPKFRRLKSKGRALLIGKGKLE
ncbi:hypothetical protein EMIHUDRAFT_218337 [Emiliania huxleyi CCMP1516]|uniref:Uncharacterized protein n=2 Tax=Emiliania huxleyi TaxID=2903 RepID=A0A0D3I933_EMIH1|nr:hypothetical protein EMIHUDRAFT_218337 [Emiliania huxleyi CCMP1516]EOD07768.1 hypothetical protein EMIHUDRAFT_218337 [Emiliania huxleyi CCMP1516]|eukprot:XP_005760197.1 hypothetical protein EMIHUDRAFT_218337 [Emiliania huxleyi CCMP1516]